MADTPRSRSRSRSASASSAGGGSRSAKSGGTKRAASSKTTAAKGASSNSTAAKAAPAKTRRSTTSSSGGGTRTAAKRKTTRKAAGAGRGLPGLSLRTLVMTAVAVTLVVVGAAIGVSVDKSLREQSRAEETARAAADRAAAPRPAPAVTPPQSLTPAPAPEPAPVAAPAPPPVAVPPAPAPAPAPVKSSEAVDYEHAYAGYTEVPPMTPPAAVPAPKVKPAPPAETQVAALPTPPKSVFRPAPKAFDGEAPWVKYAVPSPAVNGRPMIAIVIDDLGIDKAGAKKIVSLPGPITTAWMTYADNVAAQARAARAAGHELIIHMPMEPLNSAIDSGPDVLKTTMTPDQVRRQVRHGFDQFDGYVGINNHMGSKFTADTEGMRVVIDELRSRGLLWLDSKTSPKSVGARLAEQAGIPFAERHVFIDNTETVPAVLKQLAETEKVARKTGYAIAIGHPHDATYQALKQWLPTLEDKGLVLVPLSAIVRKRMGLG